MRVDELDIPDEVSDALVEAGYVNLHPPQAEAIPKALEGRSLVVAIPTASGKSLIGIVPALKRMVVDRVKVLYIVPLKALASEKRDDLEKFSKLGIRVHMSTGDLDSDDRGMSDADIIVATSEKADSMIRHGSAWIRDVGLVIADEVHMIHDPGRGPTLEVALTKMMRRNRDLQIIALSATISNACDLAEWLHADLVSSDWRPIPLKEGVFYNDRITFGDLTYKDVPRCGEDMWSLLRQTVDEGGQCLIFVNSRRSTEALAVKFSKNMSALAGRELSQAEIDAMEGDSESTATGRKLSSCVACGMAFHNAGLTYKQRRYVEEGFRAGLIKCIVATPTLAAGINLPARRVIIRDTNRYESNAGNSPIPVMEIKQMSGRAGRPGYDPYGEAVLIAKNDRDYDHLMEDYVDHETERLTSKLFNERVLRSHILGIIATGDADSEEGVVDFLRETFFGTTSQLFGIESVVGGVVDFLEKEDMVRRDGDMVEIMPFGKRVSDLCIDPASASILRDAVLKIDESTEPMQILIAGAMTPDVVGLYPKKCDEARLQALEEQYGDRLLVDPEDVDDYMYEFFESDLKTAALVSDWIEEVPEDVMTESMGIGPGDIRAKVDMMDWIVYSMNEIALIFNPDAVRRIRPLMTRIRYGVKEELMDLVSFRGVGRSRARIMFQTGLRTRSDIASADESQLAAIPKIGPALAKSMKDQAGYSPRESRALPPSEEEAMLDEMAAEYGEPTMAEIIASAPKHVEGAPETTEKRPSKGKGHQQDHGPKQSSLFDF